MPSKAPPIPPEQRARGDRHADIDGATLGRRDEATGVQSDQPGDDDVNLAQQGRQANTAQNLRHQGSHGARGR